MKCHYCGTELPQNVRFCRHCGTRQDEMSRIAEQPSVTEAAPAQNPYEFPMPKPAPVFDEQSYSWKPLPEEMPAPEKYTAPEEEFPVITPPVTMPPRIQLPVKRSLAKMIFLSILTLGIYPTVIWSRIVTELNIAASRHDGRRTMPFFGMIMLSPITLGIYGLVWMHEFSDRIGCELARRNLDYKFGAKDFWIWNFLFSLLIAAVAVALYLLIPDLHYAVFAVLSILGIIGPYVYVHKLMKAMNLVNRDFNVNG